MILTIFQLILIVAVIVYLTANMIYLVRLKPIFMSIPNAPKISVCVPARNEARGVKECLKSLLNQDYSNFEVIVVDDHSTDHTEIILHALSKEEPNLKVLKGADLPNGWL